MKRTTKKQLENLAVECNRVLPRSDGWHYIIGWAYGRPRLELSDARCCCRDVSPRLPKGELQEWIWAYLKGAAAAAEIRPISMEALKRSESLVTA